MCCSQRVGLLRDPPGREIEQSSEKKRSLPAEVSPSLRRSAEISHWALVLGGASLEVPGSGHSLLSLLLLLLVVVVVGVVAAAVVVVVVVAAALLLLLLLYIMEPAADPGLAGREPGGRPQGPESGLGGPAGLGGPGPGRDQRPRREDPAGGRVLNIY